MSREQFVPHSSNETRSATAEPLGVAYEEFQGHLVETMDRLTARPCPPRLAQALRHAVLGGGHRYRPRLCIAAAWASTGTVNSVCHDYAVSLELLHCASLVHDDLPCFDDAGQRRGRLTVHRAFGEASAVLVGDSLVIAAFEQLGRVAALSPVTAGELVALLAQAAGVPRGLTAGQAWEEEPTVALSQYHDAKTAALFEAALVGGARAAGARGEPWRPLGRLLGRAYQLADDLLDATSWGGGKTSGRDAELERPSAVRVLGLDQTKVRLQQAVDQIFSVVPPCQGEHEFRLFLAEIVDALGVVLPAA